MPCDPHEFFAMSLSGDRLALQCDFHIEVDYPWSQFSFFPVQLQRSLNFVLVWPALLNNEQTFEHTTSVLWALIYLINFREVAGKQLTVIFIKNSASSSSTISFAVADLGARDKASAVTNNFPGTCAIELSTLASRK